jgi:hypothetical protein
MSTADDQHGKRKARRLDNLDLADEADAADAADDADHVDGGETFDAGTTEDAARLGAGLPPPGATVDAALTALLEAGPEAVEHLLKAAQELLLAAKAVVDAGERAVEAHRTAADAPEPAAGDEPAERPGRVRRIDLA